MSNHNHLSIVYMGTPQFAVEPLRALLDANFKVSAVVTTPDKPAGRGQKLSQSAVKQFAQERNLNLLQPERLKEKEFIETLISLKPDIIIVVAFRMLPEAVWQIPRLGTFNLHASLLPNYRGAAPINWAVINGDTTTGLTTFLIDQQIDTGSILLSRQVSILPNETAGELHDKLMGLGGELVVETVEGLAAGNLKSIPQLQLTTAQAPIKPAPKLFKENTRICWGKSSIEIHNMVRGLSPYPAAWTELVGAEGETITAKIFRTQLIESSVEQLPLGQISSDGKSFLHVQCAKGKIAVMEIQLAGKRNLTVREFLSGYRGIEACRFV